MKLHTKYNIILIGILSITLLFYYSNNKTLKEGSLGSDARRLQTFLDRSKNIMSMYVPTPH